MSSLKIVQKFTNPIDNVCWKMSAWIDRAIPEGAPNPNTGKPLDTKRAIADYLKRFNHAAPIVFGSSKIEPEFDMAANLGQINVIDVIGTVTAVGVKSAFIELNANGVKLYENGFITDDSTLMFGYLAQGIDLADTVLNCYIHTDKPTAVRDLITNKIYNGEYDDGSRKSITARKEEDGKHHHAEEDRDRTSESEG